MAASSSTDPLGGPRGAIFDDDDDPSVALARALQFEEDTPKLAQVRGQTSAIAALSGSPGSHDAPYAAKISFMKSTVLLQKSISPPVNHRLM